MNDAINNSLNVKGRLPQHSAANWAPETTAVLLLRKTHYCVLYIWNSLPPFSSALTPCSYSSWIRRFCFCLNCSVKSWQGAYSQLLEHMWERRKHEKIPAASRTDVTFVKTHPLIQLVFSDLFGKCKFLFQNAHMYCTTRGHETPLSTNDCITIRILITGKSFQSEQALRYFSVVVTNFDQWKWNAMLSTVFSA